MNDEYEVRAWSEGNMLISDNYLKMIKFDLEQKRYYEDQREKHELEMAALKAQSKLFFPKLFRPFW